MRSDLGYTFIMNRIIIYISVLFMDGSSGEEERRQAGEGEIQKIYFNAYVMLTLNKYVNQ